MSDPVSGLVRIRGLRVGYGRGATRREVLHGIDLDIATGERVGLIGETGSGKSTLARTILGLTRIAAGDVRVDGEDLTTLRGRRLRAHRRHGVVQYVYQDPLRSLDPRIPVGESVAEGLRIRGGLSRSEIAGRVEVALDAVGLSRELADRLPADISGGQRQRIAIARALVLDPRLLILDEPVSALDATSRVHVLDLLQLVAAEKEFAQLYISHDLGSVAGITDRLVVLFRGDIVEDGPTADVIARPRHPYTRLLLESAPTLSAGGADRARRQELRGQLDSPPVDFTASATAGVPGSR